MEKDLNATNTIIKNEIQVILRTTLPQEYLITNNIITVPSNYDSEKLNKLVEKLLRSKNDKKFSFFIENISLDTDLNSFLQNNSREINLKKISETGLEIFYQFELEEPKLVNTIKEDEWIRKIHLRLNQKFDTSNLEYFSVALFNSEITIYNKNFEKILKIEDLNKEENYCELLHDVLFFRPSYSQSDSTDSNILIRASRNEYYNFEIFSVDLNRSSYKKIYINRKNNSEYFNSLALNPVDFSYFVAGDTEGNLKIFKIPESFEEPNITLSKTKKKRKTEINELEYETVIENCHSGNEVKIVKWINNKQMITSGDDFVVKLWNIHTKTNFASFNTNYKLTTCIVTTGNENEKFLTGHEDGTVKLWDSRVNNSSNQSKIISWNAHTNYVSDLSCNPNKDFYSNNFASVGYDGNLKIWDVRQNKNFVYEIRTDSEKNYSVGYNSSDYLMTGGDSSTLNIFENKLLK
jgi:hypothetical protein